MSTPRRRSFLLEACTRIDWWVHPPVPPDPGASPLAEAGWDLDTWAMRCGIWTPSDDARFTKQWPQVFTVEEIDKPLLLDAMRWSIQAGRIDVVPGQRDRWRACPARGRRVV